ncbi:endo alpha-1,4 polygalactosaminidase [Marinobacter lipolyticus]|uniref:endo alpha-1,4 polygalactosaminidase n=1 Tax=Marinobacter lipolyticus TaxID=209639 RepID=UPI001D1921C5|nr:endo alpha-1,4 polygalactosaminidase [Marinobacter lipolyticus]
MRSPLLLLCFISFLLPLSEAHAKPDNIGFYYGNESPIGSLYAYDWLILQQDQVPDARLQLLAQGGTLPLAYVSVGEMARSHRLYAELDASWKLGENPDWNSAVLDLRNVEVRRFLIERLVAPAIARGFRGVFLDTLDSHLLVAPGKTDPDGFATGQQHFIRDVKARFPDTKIILNRGFHLTGAIDDLVDGVAFESYREGYDPGRKRYYSVSDQDRQWLESQLAPWREQRPDIPLIAIDYVQDASRAPELAARLREDNLVPVVTNPALTRLGPTLPATQARHVLVIHDLPASRMDQSNAHRRLGIVLERMGLVPQYRSSHQPVPAEPVSDRYLGVVLWWESVGNHRDICRWLEDVRQQNVPVVFMGLTPGESPCRQLFEADGFALPATPLTFSGLAPTVAEFEGRRLPAAPAAVLPTVSTGTPWITATDTSGRPFHPVYTFAGGGVALAPFLFEPGPDDDVYWLFDPFSFLSEALGQPRIPAIDSTTESGRRILTAHIDGDGLVSRGEFPGSPLSGAVITDKILQRFDIPHTVSVIEAETSPAGLYPRISKETEALARAMFRMPNVEVASHSYSHPFFWQSLEGGPAPRLENTLYGYFMNIPDYQASLDREIAGSVAYINRSLAPPDKPVSIFLWTGDARPGQRALEKVREAGLVNVNGGDTHPLPYSAELAGTWPDAKPVGDELQVYAPVMNENVYTGEWAGPFYGFRYVIDTFEILEKRGRLKPMGIYYHFYSGTKPGALNALGEIYQYALAQPVTPLYLSEYAERVQAQYYSALMKSQDGGYRWRGLHAPTTVRIRTDQYPDLERSTGVAGFHDAAGARFVHLTGDDPTLYLSNAAPEGPYLSDANAVITGWHRKRASGVWQLDIGLTAYQPLEAVFANARGCRVMQPDDVTATFAGNNLRLTLPVNQVSRLSLECR